MPRPRCWAFAHRRGAGAIECSDRGEATAGGKALMTTVGRCWFRGGNGDDLTVPAPASLPRERVCYIRRTCERGFAGWNRPVTRWLDVSKRRRPRSDTGRADLMTRSSIDITIPVLNEQRAIDSTLSTLVSYLSVECPYDWRITVVDNGSTDRTWSLATSFAAEHSHTRTIRLDRPGRGGALKEAWSTSSADVVAYMDVDLSTGLDSLQTAARTYRRGGSRHFDRFSPCPRFHHRAKCSARVHIKGLQHDRSEISSIFNT